MQNTTCAKNYFSDALTIFNQLAETNQESDILFQKIGYCKQMNDDLQGALDAYLRGRPFKSAKQMG